jgi:hypothetical protein
MTKKTTQTPPLKLNRVVVTPFTATPSRGESNFGLSKTVPDESISVRDLLLNHSRGHSLPVSERVAFYDEDNVIPDPKGLDLTDLDAMRLENESTRDKILKEARSQRIKAQQEKQKAVEDELRLLRQAKSDADKIAQTK